MTETVRKGVTIKLSAGPKMEPGVPPHALPNRARLSYDPEGGAVKIDAGSPSVMTKYGIAHAAGDLTPEAALALLELLLAWRDGAYE